MDPRNPKRPEGDAGANWALCVDCGRGAPKAAKIRHTRRCLASFEQVATQRVQSTSGLDPETPPPAEE